MTSPAAQHRARRVAVVVLLVLALAMPSRAEDSAASSWYGWQVLSVGAVGIPLGAGGFGTQSGALAGVGVPIYLLGPSLVHLAHGRLGGAGAGLVLRLTLPLVGGAIGAGVASGCSGEMCGLGPVLGGFAAGAAAATILDAAFLCTVRDHPQNPTPRLQVFGGGKTIALRGAF
jgi:hypothetical protein